jgi:hypothetical protein
MRFTHKTPPKRPGAHSQHRRDVFAVVALLHRAHIVALVERVQIKVVTGAALPQSGIVLHKFMVGTSLLILGT